jgi:hypothetical protein
MVAKATIAQNFAANHVADKHDWGILAKIRWQCGRLLD